MEITKTVQSRYFGKEIVLLSKQKKLEPNSRIFKLDQDLDAQCVIKSWWQDTKISDSTRNPTSSAIAKGLQNHELDSWYHDKVAHAGRGITIKSEYLVFGSLN